MSTKLLLADNNDSFTWNLVQLVKEVAIISIDVLKTPELKIPELKKYDKILFSPGPGLPNQFPVLKEIVDVYKQTKSILGVCLGHQAIAEAFGGKLKNLETVHHGTREEIEILDQSEYLFKCLPPTFIAGLYHSWTVDPDFFPEELKVTAISKSGNIMGISHSQFDVRGIQFHPESYMTFVGKQIINNWLNSKS
jgi:anthranilate synthase component II